MQHRYWTIAISLLLVGCNPEASKERQLADKARSGLMLVLKDPSSAQFTDIVENKGAICGFVNAKNSMGAYSGFKAFLVKGDEALVDTDDHSVEFAKKFDASCPLELSSKQLSIAVDAHIAALNEMR